MSRRTIKKEILQILALEDLVSVKEVLVSFQPAEIINPLFSALCSTSLQVKWHAVSAFGWFVPAIAESNIEAARVIMRRFLWSLNDESGGIGWGAPEAMAEIMTMDVRLAEEYLHMLISYTREDGPELFQDGNFLELPMLQRGLLWGVGRLCQACKKQMVETGVGEDLRAYLTSDDAEVPGLAVWCLSLLGDTSAKSDVLTLQHDYREVPIYQDGVFSTYTISELVDLYLLQYNRGKN